MNRIAALLAGKFSLVALVPIGLGMVQVAHCSRFATSVEEVQSCWKVGLGIGAVGGGALAGYNIPNPKLDRVRHELAVELDQPTERAAAAPPPEPPVMAPEERDSFRRHLEQEELPEGWERDEHGRLRDEHGRFASEPW